MSDADVRAPRVLHSPVNIAGGPGALSRGLRELGHESTLLVFSEQAFGREADINLGRGDGGGVRQLLTGLPRQFRALAWALPRFDVFHFHFGLTLVPKRINIPVLRALRKGIVFHCWGSDIRNRRAEQVAYLRHADAVILGSFHVRRLAPTGPFPPYSIVPPGIVLDDYPPHVTEPGRTIRIAHAPSKRAVKGTQAVLDAVASLRAAGAPVELDLIEGVPHDEARRRYEAADLIVDQLRIGWHGLFAIESMALGKPVVCRLDAEARAETRDAWGIPCPIVDADEGSLAAVLRRLVGEPAQLPELGRAGRAYVEQVHAHTAVARRMLDVYRTAGLRVDD